MMRTSTVFVCSDPTRWISPVSSTLSSFACTAAGTFRDDLFYRLNVFPIRVPPLRERPEDIPLLVWRFVEEFATAFGKRVDSISRDNMAALQAYAWPGNIRELRNVVERAMITATNPRLAIAVPTGTAAAAKGSAKLIDVERSHIRSVLEITNWRIRGPGGAADRLGLEARHGLPVARRIAGEEVGGERADVLGALAERREADLDRIEPEEQVFAEAARGY